MNLIKKNDATIFGIMETKLKVRSLDKIMKNKFKNWKFVHNFYHHIGGRRLVVWDPSRVVFNPKLTTSQILHGTLFCQVRKIQFELSFIYALNNLVK